MADNTVEVVLKARDQMSQKLDQVSGKVSGFKTVSVNAFIEIAQKAAQAVGAIARAADAGSKFADRIGDMARKLNVSTESLSALSLAAEVTGSNLESMETGLRTLNRQALVAAQGSKSLGELFNRLGVNVQDAEGNLRPTEELLGDIADGMVNLGSETERAAIAQTLFGRAGGDLIPIMNQGAAGLKRFTDRADELGILIDQETVKAADLFQDTLVQLRQASLGVSVSLGRGLLPQLQPLIANFVSFTAEVAKWIDETRVGEGIAMALTVAFRVVGTIVAVLVNGFERLAARMAGIAAVAVAIANRDFSLIPGILKETAKEIENADDRMKRFISSLSSGEKATKDFNDAMNESAEGSNNAAGAYLLQSQELDKLKESLDAANQSARQGILANQAAAAEAAGFQTEAIGIRLQATLEGIQAEEEARNAQLESERMRIEQSNVNETLKAEQMKIIDDTITANRIKAEGDRLKATQEAGEAAIEVMQSTVGPVTSAVESATTAMIQGEMNANEALKQIGQAALRTILNQVIDRVTAELLANQVLEIGKATIAAPGTFGASLLRIPLILAAAAAARGAVAAIRLQGGGVVEGGSPGRDSVPALLEPGELVIPRHMTESIRHLMGSSPEGFRFQEGGMVGEGGGPLIGTLAVDNLSDFDYVDRLIDRINEAVTIRNRPLFASEIR